MFAKRKEPQTTPYQQGFNCGFSDAEMGFNRKVVHIDCGDVAAFKEGYAEGQKEYRSVSR